MFRILLVGVGVALVLLIPMMMMMMSPVDVSHTVQNAQHDVVIRCSEKIEQSKNKCLSECNSECTLLCTNIADAHYKQDCEPLARFFQIFGAAQVNYFSSDDGVALINAVVHRRD